MGYEGHLVENHGGIPVNLSNGVLATGWEPEGPYHGPLVHGSAQVTWLTDFAESPNKLVDVGVSYGNEATANFVYCSPCLIVPISPASSRPAVWENR